MNVSTPRAQQFQGVLPTPPKRAEIKQGLRKQALQHDVPDKALRTGNVILNFHSFLRQIGLPV